MKHIIHLTIAVLVAVVIGNLLVALAVHYHL